MADESASRIEKLLEVIALELYLARKDREIAMADDAHTNVIRMAPDDAVERTLRELDLL